MPFTQKAVPNLHSLSKTRILNTHILYGMEDFEKQQLFELIESWNPQKIHFAIKVMQANPLYEEAVIARYGRLMDFAGIDTYDQLVWLGSMLNRKLSFSCKDKEVGHGFKPTLEEQNVLTKLNNPRWHLLKDFPEWASYQQNATVFNASFITQEAIPKWIGRLVNLKKIEIKGSRIKTIPDSIGNCTLIESIELKKTSIESIPNSLGQLLILKSLVINEGKLKRIPAEIGKCKQLECLKIMFNRIDQIPVSLKNLQKLNTLYLTGNNLSKVPDEIGLLQNLEVLVLSGNPITELPKSFRQLKKLKALFITKTNLTKIPKWINQLENLSTLAVGDTSIKTFPKSILDLEIKYLNITNSEIENAFGKLYYHKAGIKDYIKNVIES